MAQLSCERPHENTIRIDGHLDIQFHEAPIKPNHDMADPLPDDGALPLQFLPRDGNKQQLNATKHMGLYLHMPRELFTSTYAPMLSKLNTK